MTKPKRTKDWTDLKFHLLTFVRPTEDRTPERKIVWEARCDCGTTVFVAPSYAKRGHVKSCGCLPRKREDVPRRYSNPNNHPRIYHEPPAMTIAKNIWRERYSDGDCTFEEFYKLSQQACFYCLTPPSKVRIGKTLRGGSFTYNGLDRIDSALPHDIVNLVPCCYTCNRMKNDHSLDEFLAHIERLYEGTRRLREDPITYATLFEMPQTKPTNHPLVGLICGTMTS
jgi:hypothetical protein